MTAAPAPFLRIPDRAQVNAALRAMPPTPTEDKIKRLAKKHGCDPRVLTIVIADPAWIAWRKVRQATNEEDMRQNMTAFARTPPQSSLTAELLLDLATRDDGLLDEASAAANDTLRAFLADRRG